jgi:hypothetical protein
VEALSATESLTSLPSLSHGYSSNDVAEFVQVNWLLNPSMHRVWVENMDLWMGGGLGIEHFLEVRAAPQIAPSLLGHTFAQPLATIRARHTLLCGWVQQPVPAPPLAAALPPRAHVHPAWRAVHTLAPPPLTPQPLTPSIGLSAPRPQYPSAMGTCWPLHCYRTCAAGWGRSGTPGSCQLWSGSFGAPS